MYVKVNDLALKSSQNRDVVNAFCNLAGAKKNKKFNSESIFMDRNCDHILKYENSDIFFL